MVSSGWDGNREVAAHRDVLAPHGVTDRKMSLKTTCHAALVQLDDVSCCGGRWSSEAGCCIDMRSFPHNVSPEGDRGGGGGVCGQDRV
jgi:hypothetical protein